MMPLENLGEVIEQIRSNRNITIDSLCEGIMSHSTYHRFVRGKSNIASDSFVKLVGRLHMTLAMFLQDYQGFFKLKHDYAILNHAKYSREVKLIQDLISVYQTKEKTSRLSVFEERFLKVARALNKGMANKGNKTKLSLEIIKEFTAIHTFSDNDYFAFVLLLDFISLEEAEKIIAPQLQNMNLKKEIVRMETFYFLAGAMYVKALLANKDALASTYYSIIIDHNLDATDLGWKLQREKYMNFHLYFSGDRQTAIENLENLREFYLDLYLEIDARDLTRICHKLGIHLKSEGELYA